MIHEGGKWRFEEDKLFFSHPAKGNNLQVIKAIIIANGTKDLCIIKGKGEDKHVKKISEAKKENIVYIPEGDILWVEFAKPTSDGTRSMLVDLGSAQEEMKPFMRELLTRFPGKKQINYDVYAGTDW